MRLHEYQLKLNNYQQTIEGVSMDYKILCVCSKGRLDKPYICIMEKDNSYEHKINIQLEFVRVGEHTMGSIHELSFVGYVKGPFDVGNTMVFVKK